MTVMGRSRGSHAPATVALLMALLPANAAAQAPTPPPTYGFTWIAPATTNGMPQIIKVELNSDHLRAGGLIAIRVTTSPDVVKVVTGSGKRSGPLTKVAPGSFNSNSTLPHVGGPAPIPITLHFVASDAAGRSVAVDVPVTYH